ncbi:MAG: EFR1 family ferrodoxin [Oscillospiraceae bacterium]|nr:EFR1 family ferrodoxin [Oscillospiraceae bacterium]
MKVLYFTSTGNSLYVAKRIGGELLSIPQLIRDNNYEISADTVGIVVPIYGFDVPRPVRSYLNQVNIHAEYVFAVMTYGDRPMAAVSMMQKLLASRGVTLNYSNEIDMVDNYLPGYEVERQLKMKQDVDIEQAINQVIQDIDSRKNVLLYKGALAKVISSGLSAASVSPLGKRTMNGSAKKFSITSDCNSCGVCGKVCPMGNIVVEDQPNYSNNCEFCLACTHLCPQNAIRLKGEKSTARFRNRHVGLNEIIAANVQ